jgi:hypothetical protein
MSKLTVNIEAFRSFKSGTLVGFCTVVVPELRLRIVDLTVHQHANGRRWVGMPGKPQLNSDGTARRDERGKVAYTPVLGFTDKATQAAFSDRVIEALLAFTPAAFNEGAAA